MKFLTSDGLNENLHEFFNQIVKPYIAKEIDAKEKVIRDQKKRNFVFDQAAVNKMKVVSGTSTTELDASIIYNIYSVGDNFIIRCTTNDSKTAYYFYDSKNDTIASIDAPTENEHVIQIMDYVEVSNGDIYFLGQTTSPVTNKVYYSKDGGRTILPTNIDVFINNTEKNFEAHMTTKGKIIEFNNKVLVVNTANNIMETTDGENWQVFQPGVTIANDFSDGGEFMWFSKGNGHIFLVCKKGFAAIGDDESIIRTNVINTGYRFSGLQESDEGGVIITCGTDEGAQSFWKFSNFANSSEAARKTGQLRAQGYSASNGVEILRLEKINNANDNTSKIIAFNGWTSPNAGEHFFTINASLSNSNEYVYSAIYHTSPVSLSSYTRNLNIISLTNGDFVLFDSLKTQTIKTTRDFENYEELDLGLEEGEYVRDIAQDSKGNIYIATTKAGIKKLDIMEV